MPGDVHPNNSETEAKGKILIVDDDLDFAQSLHNILYLEGYTVANASNFNGALALLDDFQPEVALLDVRLGKHSGIDLISALKEQITEIRCIMMTAYASEQFTIAALQVGAFDYLHKPFAMETLRAALTRCFQHVRLEREKVEAEALLVQRNNEIENLNWELEARVKKRTQELEEVQKELIRKAHLAGMTEISTSVLHNVGNIMNSVITSSQMISRATESQAKINSLARANERLNEVAQEGRGADHDHVLKIQAFLTRFQRLLDKEQNEIRDNSQRIISKVELIKDVIRSQQNYAAAGIQMESVDLRELVDDALTIYHNTLSSLRVDIQKDYHPCPIVVVQKTQLVHVVLNLLKNAWQAIHTDEKKISITIETGTAEAIVRITDNGCGISPENLDRIFQHGFTTKEDGHGFGLHSCATSMMDMGGTLVAESEGPGKGATFTLRFPTLAR